MIGELALVGASAAIDKISKIGNGTLSSAVKIGTNILASNTIADSIVSYSGASRLEPIASIDTRLTKVGLLQDLQLTLLNLYISYYTMALSLDNQIGNVRTLNRLDKFATTRTPGYEQDIRRYIANESLFAGLPLDIINIAFEAITPAPAPDPNSNNIRINDIIKTHSKLDIADLDDTRARELRNKINQKQDEQTLQTHNKDIEFEIRKAEELAKLRLELDTGIRGQANERDLKKRQEELSRIEDTLTHDERIKYKREIEQAKLHLTDEYNQLKRDTKRHEKLNEYLANSDPNIQEQAVQHIVNKRVQEFSANRRLSDIEREEFTDELRKELSQYEIPDGPTEAELIKQKEALEKAGKTLAEGDQEKHRHDLALV